jgi:hypothetical protein
MMKDRLAWLKGWRQIAHLLTAPCPFTMGSLLVECQEALKNLLICHAMIPAIGVRDSGVEFLVGDVKPCRTLIIEGGRDRLFEGASRCVNRTGGRWVGEMMMVESAVLRLIQPNVSI